MRWNKPKQPVYYSTKLVTRFAWWPTEVQDKFVWLEKYTVEYQYFPGNYHDTSVWLVKNKYLVVKNG